MNQEREAKILEGAIEKYGAEHQITVAIEELSELIKALTKYQRYGDNTVVLAGIQEEMADVSIMLNQLELIFGDCSEQEIDKLERLERMIRNDV